MIMKSRQQGTTIVEFAAIGVVLMIVLFGVIEIARALFVWNTIGEVTRRGARVATVCPVGDSSIAEVAIFGTPGGSSASPVLSNLSTSNIDLTYRDVDGVETSNFPDIAYVQVEIVNYSHVMLIPFIPLAARTLQMPAFSTTLPVESLGYVPETGDRRCFAPGI